MMKSKVLMLPRLVNLDDYIEGAAPSLTRVSLS
ncbi:hypothetical protein SAMN06265346_1237 [Flavobacterium hercynium]|nr:hypothetical protein SAMN06265346_1237 [Flavobacterium hercynium]